MRERHLTTELLPCSGVKVLLEATPTAPPVEVITNRTCTQTAAPKLLSKARQASARLTRPLLMDFLMST